MPHRRGAFSGGLFEAGIGYGYETSEFAKENSNYEDAISICFQSVVFVDDGILWVGGCV
tara:strand:+ start:317 stop:493 length:177 start_codon:yes stop_codon:yes gene_type:complete